MIYPDETITIIENGETLTVSCDARNGIRVSLQEDDDLMSVYLTEDQAVQIGEALVRWVKAQETWVKEWK